eukprot:TRINITY_DN5286_c0_g1_i3.p1 TRINITY_DN5286_c0_g1~~TRINITY_DN5286_c0_g1_i3.p1  ORF type:complete len:277 (+),score=32.08 TRINITY_DN5286_c0_g1_i3:245-1075(+)
MSNSQLQDSMVGVKSQKEDDSVDISRCKSLLESKLSEDIKSPVTPKEFSFKDIVKRFDFEQTHSAKLLRKQSGPVSAVSLTNMDEEYCAPSHSHLIRHESLGLRKGRSLPVRSGSGFVDTVQQWVERYKSVTNTRQRETQRYGRKVPLPRQQEQSVEQVDDSVDFGRCLSISEGQNFWDELARKEQQREVKMSRSMTGPLKSIDFESCLSPRSIVTAPLRHHLGGKGEASQTTTTTTTSTSSSLSMTLDKIEEVGRDDVSVTGGGVSSRMLSRKLY